MDSKTWIFLYFYCFHIVYNFVVDEIHSMNKEEILEFKRRQEKAGGSQSIFCYEEWLETGNSKILEDLINYNEDDVHATEHHYLWLKNHSNQNAYKQLL